MSIANDQVRRPSARTASASETGDGTGGRSTTQRSAIWRTHTVLRRIEGASGRASLGSSAAIRETRIASGRSPVRRRPPCRRRAPERTGLGSGRRRPPCRTVRRTATRARSGVPGTRRSRRAPVREAPIRQAATAGPRRSRSAVRIPRRRRRSRPPCRRGPSSRYWRDRSGHGDGRRGARRRSRQSAGRAPATAARSASRARHARREGWRRPSGEARSRPASCRRPAGSARRHVSRR